MAGFGDAHAMEEMGIAQMRQMIGKDGEIRHLESAAGAPLNGRTCRVIGRDSGLFGRFQVQLENREGQVQRLKVRAKNILFPLGSAAATPPTTHMGDAETLGALRVAVSWAEREAATSHREDCVARIAFVRAAVERGAVSPPCRCKGTILPGGDEALVEIPRLMAAVGFACIGDDHANFASFGDAGTESCARRLREWFKSWACARSARRR